MRFGFRFCFVIDVVTALYFAEEIIEEEVEIRPTSPSEPVANELDPGKHQLHETVKE